MAKGKALGRGLGALIPDYEMDALAFDGSETTQIDIDLIKPNSRQPRKDFNQEQLASLAESIKEYGILQPILVTKDGDFYMLAAGERRYRAAIIAGLEKVPVVVKELTEREMAEIAIIENLQREGLNDIEEANAYHQLNTSFGVSHDKIAALAGKSRVAVSNSIRLLQLPQAAQDLIIQKQLSAGHGRAVLSLHDLSLSEEFALYIVEHSLTVRDAEELAKTFGMKEQKPEKMQAMRYPEMEESLSQAYGTKVSIKATGKSGKGKIVIEFYGNGDFQRIINQLGLYES
ncbi:MAG: ParB/RepB/Spo0J family partition protein [Eubacteriaceae bacterium]|nr:ParB/RepB/Spo0J family partition protein [Eubacteriaceae bacterium]